MNYYYNFTTGLIDGLLTRMAIEPYAFAKSSNDPILQEGGRLTEATSDDWTYSKYLNEKVIRNNVIDFKAPMPGKLHDNSRAFGTKTIPIDKYLREYLENLNADIFSPSTSAKEIDYNKEYGCPFNQATKVKLLTLKWIAGIQALTKDIVVVDKESLEAIGLEGASPLDIKKSFDKLFYNNIVHSSYDKGKWYVKLGRRDIAVGEGPGYINMRIGIPYLEDKIKAYHIVLKESLLTLENK